jgi:protein gp37
VIVGGESGPDARPCRTTWIRDIVRQCADAQVPCFVKQFGANAEDGHGCHRKLKLNHKKGGDPSEWPEDLRVQQFPEVRR